ncbi:tRNA 2-selenouridine synthase [Emticicia aquatica]|uniref:tRNA 2-selenouridine synthase n=1 Tax=Emticicia aquatica TaxID=1681835 RepID=A0ABN8EYW7_9BACT|nr:tRNA 2-selenouridine(34) synthase MnmH [Emticicia aquatica]CAH0996861.1 tRNA 2-selenouridine synthase [Emticicia aquatica]
MIKPLPVEQFLEKSKTIPIIDVRSPGEFERGHIVGAINIPLFENHERAEVGTRYKKVGKESAFLLGLDIVGPKLSGFVKKSRKIAPDGEVLVHCWRGGMRSGSFATLLASAGMKVSILVGGYKKYRNYILDEFNKPLDLIVLGGKTGSGKTEILYELAKQGEQILDLEGLANHKGSSFGMLGQPPQPMTEHFENMLYQKWAELDKSRRIWIEDESRNVGCCNIPDGLWQQMRTAKTAFIDVDKQIRVSRLVKEYAHFSFDELKSATDRILKRLGGQHHKAAIEALEKGDFSVGTEIALNYYDKTYLHGLSKRDASQITTFIVKHNDTATTALELIAGI